MYKNTEQAQLILILHQDGDLNDCEGGFTGVARMVGASITKTAQLASYQ